MQIKVFSLSAECAIFTYSPKTCNSAGEYNHKMQFDYVCEAILNGIPFAVIMQLLWVVLVVLVGGVCDDE